MMKKLFAALVGLILCNNVWAQKEPGTVTLYPRIGMNLSKFSGDKILPMKTALSVQNTKAEWCLVPNCNTKSASPWP